MFLQITFFVSTFTISLSENLNNTHSALVLLAEGNEESEAVSIIDVLRRGELKTTVAGIAGSSPVKGYYGTLIVPDTELSKVSNENYDVVVLPGGLDGSKNLASSSLVGQVLKKQEQAGRYIGAICAAPLALKAHNIGLKKRITSHPLKAHELRDDYHYSDDRVVVDGKLITSRGPATTYEFALTIVEHLAGKSKAEEVRSYLLVNNIKGPNQF